MNWRFWRSRYFLPAVIVVGVIVGALFLLYVGFAGVSPE